MRRRFPEGHGERMRASTRGRRARCARHSCCFARRRAHSDPRGVRAARVTQRPVGCLGSGERAPQRARGRGRRRARASRARGAGERGGMPERSRPAEVGAEMERRDEGTEDRSGEVRELTATARVATEHELQQRAEPILARPFEPERERGECPRCALPRNAMASTRDSKCAS